MSNQTDIPTPAESSTEPEATQLKIELPPEPAPPFLPILDGVRRLVGSSKALVIGGCLAVLAVLTYQGQIEASAAVEAMLWLAGIFAGSVAVEDAAAKLRSRRGIYPGHLQALAVRLRPSPYTAPEIRKLEEEAILERAEEIKQERLDAAREDKEK